MPTSQEIEGQQKQIWNTAAPGWKKWDDYLDHRFGVVSEAMLDAARLKDGYQVLELACGTGVPGIPAAKRVGKGRVIGTDLAEDMVEVAKQKAKSQGVSNYDTQIASALSLPFPDSYFDSVLCRWGIMFFPNPPACLKETLRVLKPGATAVFATWNVPPKNPHVSLAMSVAISILGIAPPPPDAPGIFHYADIQKLSNQMTEAGFKDVQAREVTGALDYDSPQHFWEFVTDVVGPFKAAMKNATPQSKEKVREAFLKKAGEMEQDGRVRMTYSSWVVSGNK